MVVRTCPAGGVPLTGTEHWEDSVPSSGHRWAPLTVTREGMCVFIGVAGKRCQEERWWLLDISNWPIAFFFFLKFMSLFLLLLCWVFISILWLQCAYLRWGQPAVWLFFFFLIYSKLLSRGPRWLSDRVHLPTQETWVHSWSGKIPHAEWQLSPCTTTAEAQAAAWASALQQVRPPQGAHVQQRRPSTAKKDKILKKINCSLVEMSHLTFHLLWVWDHWGFNVLCTEPELVLSSFLVRKEEKFWVSL